MQSELNGRLRNTNLPYSKGLMPVFEAVINSIEAIEERNLTEQKALSDYSIKLEIDRLEQLEIDPKPGPRPEGEIRGFRITDNGVGFTDKNWESFGTLDSLHKVEKGCRGIGRLMWLKAFDNAVVRSVYIEDGEVKRRNFSFNINKEVHNQPADSGRSAEIGTVVELLGFKEPFASATHKTLEKIASGLLEHCLWYFIRAEGVPEITVSDNLDSIGLFELFEAHMHNSSASETIRLKQRTFEITHVKVRVDRNKAHTLGYCASGRLVREENITSKIPGLYRAITDTGGQFTYMAYLISDYLDEQVTTERVSFNISEDVEGLFVENEISYSDIRAAVYPRIAKYLEADLEEVLSDGRERVETFVSTTAPKYRPLLSYMPSERLAVDPSVSDKELDLLLHREVFEVEQDILREGHELLSDVMDYEDYTDRLADYMDKVTDLRQSDLANYVAHRRVIIDLLEFAIKRQGNGQFVREDVIHELIVPMRATSADSEYQRQNLWLVDERLAFHHFLASDLPLTSNPTTGSESTTEPDIATIRVFENPLLVGEGGVQQASITVIEIKRPMREGYQAGESEAKDPILQSLGYLRRLREGACTVQGRPIPNAERIPGFVYVLADLTKSLVDCCKMHQLQATSDGMGYFGYHRDESYNAYIQVISFDGLVQSAKERNRAFFDTLGLPAT
ncbi:MAG: ATP-binding protein [Deltaproteobacteria bacterium]|nr:ATP-binding protein [Deltaproteobacteria bacterium]